MSMTMEEENIKVAVRIRPMQNVERKEGDIPCVKASDDGKEVQVKVGPLDASAYRCNQCFGNETTQSEFFNECGITELLDSAMKGYRSCAFAFGQTGAGKTFTMVGTPKGAGVSHHNREKQNGLISRSLEYLFIKLEEAGVQFSIKLSCLEIYHEQVFDLFAEEKDRTPLAVREHAADGFFIEGCKLVDCISYAVANAAFEAAAKNRQTGSHDLNSRSSRSHCLTEIHIEIPVTVGADGGIDGGITHSGEPGLDSGLTQGEYMSRGKISLVDLAGSERLKSTKSTGKVLQEAGFINKSLYVLGKVIAGLIRTNGDLNHKDVPYRDSKLTKLLISSLGGRSRTLLISCVSEAKSNMAETLRTLKFSMSCARIRNKPMKFLDPQEKLILDLKEEIKRLRNENKKLRSNLLTAPASGEKLGRQSDDENNSIMSRAYSAHSSLERDRIKFKPRNGGKIYGTKMNSSQSDYIKKLSPVKRGRVGKAERKMTKKEALQMLDNMRADRLAKTAAGQHRGQQGGGGGGGPGGARAGLRQDYDDDVSSIGSASSYQQQQRQQASEMDDLVRRRATGPMIFRGDSAKDLSPVRETASAYSPAQNGARSMDALRIAELEKRIARMETGVLAQPHQGYPHDHHMEAHVELSRYHTTQEAAGAAAMPLEHMLGMDAVIAGQVARRTGAVASISSAGAKKKTKKVKEDPTLWKGKQNSASPYIAHLIEAAPKANQEKNPFGGVRTVVGSDHAPHVVAVAAIPKPTRSRDENESLPPTKPKAAGRSSADNLRNAVAAGRKAAPTPAPEPAAKGPSKDLHSSIEDELAELGLGPLPVASAGPAAGAATRKKAGEKQTAKAPDRDARSNSRNRGPAAKNPSAPALLASDASAKGRETKKAAGPVKATVLPPMREKAKSASGSRDSAAAMAALVTPSKTASDSGALRVKLEALEASLVEERERMEDNPGEVTAEAEEHYEELTKQARMLRKKLEMSGLDLSFQKDDLDESAPTPEAVRLMARQMETLNAPSSKGRSAPMSKEPSTSDLMFQHISRQASTVKPAAVAAAALEDDDGYGDDDFEDDARSKPSTAKLMSPAPAATMFLTKEFSRKFEELELSVPDVSKYIQPIPEESKSKIHRSSSIHNESEDAFQVGTEEESASMRYSGVVAVHNALSFNSQQEHPFASRDSAGSRESEKGPAVSIVPQAALSASKLAASADVADEYEEDTYEDEFADEDAEAETNPTPLVAAQLAPQVIVQAAPVAVQPMSAFSPQPATSRDEPKVYETPILDSPPKDKYGRSSKSSKSKDSHEEDSPAASPTHAPIVESTPKAPEAAAPVSLSAPAPVSHPNSYDEEENYEDTYEEEFEADASVRLPADSGRAESRPKSVQAGQIPAAEQEREPEAEYELEQPENVQAEKHQISVKSAPPQSASPEPVTTSSFSSPSVKVKASPAKSGTSKRAQTPGDAEDDYGGDDFDDYDVSFGD